MMHAAYLMTPRIHGGVTGGGRVAAGVTKTESSLKHSTLHAEGRSIFSMRAPSRTIARAGLPGLTFVEGYNEVDDVDGMRVQMEGEQPRVEYLVKWKVGQLEALRDSCPAAHSVNILSQDGSESTWWVATELDCC